MDSGNSGSMQSSSGGDEEYDSRAEAISPFFNPSLNFGSISNHPQPPPPPPQPLSHQHQSHPTTLFDPSAQNLGAFSRSPANPNANTLYNLDLVWSRGLRSEPNFPDLGNFTGLSSSSISSSSQSLLGPQGPSQGPFPSSSSMPLQSVDGSGGRTTPRSDQTNVAKNSRKRTRASRRAPTTVLTTDTSNFRQMVQEFTGIPAPPFSASPYSRRFDLFGPGSAFRSAHLETLGPLYPFRPSAQKVQPSPFGSSSSSSSLLNSTISTNNTITTSIAGPSNTFTSTSNSYQLPSELGLLPKQPQTMLTMQNPILSFQNLLQSPINAPVFGSKSQESSAIPLDELGMRHEHLSANLGGFSSHGRSEGGQEHLGSFDGNNGGESQNVGGYKLNCSASTSEFHPEKGLENVSSRNEGTVDSWICPSD